MYNCGFNGCNSPHALNKAYVLCAHYISVISVIGPSVNLLPTNFSFQNQFL